jgi:hypothetical protein
VCAHAPRRRAAGAHMRERPAPSERAPCGRHTAHGALLPRVPGSLRSRRCCAGVARAHARRQARRGGRQRSKRRRAPWPSVWRACAPAWSTGGSHTPRVSLRSAPPRPARAGSGLTRASQHWAPFLARARPPAAFRGLRRGSMRARAAQTCRAAARAPSSCAQQRRRRAAGAHLPGAEPRPTSAHLRGGARRPPRCCRALPAGTGTGNAAAAWRARMRRAKATGGERCGEDRRGVINRLATRALPRCSSSAAPRAWWCLTAARARMRRHTAQQRCAAGLRSGRSCAHAGGARRAHARALGGRPPSCMLRGRFGRAGLPGVAEEWSRQRIACTGHQFACTLTTREAALLRVLAAPPSCCRLCERAGRLAARAVA